MIVLDEPNASLDRVGEAALLRALNSLKKMGTTIVIVAHHAAMLSGVDKMLVLNEGRVSAFGPKKEVLAHLSSGERAEPASPGSQPGSGIAKE